MEMEVFSEFDVQQDGCSFPWQDQRSIQLIQHIWLREDIQKKDCIKSENGTIGGEGVRKIIEF